MDYFYHTAQGRAVLNVEGKPLKNIGNFRTEHDARKACEAHYAKACKAAENFKRRPPVAHFC